MTEDGKIEFYEVDDIHKKLGVSKYTFDAFLRNTGDIERSAEKSLDATEITQHKWFVEGHSDKPFRHLADLEEGGEMSFLNPQKLTKASIQERRQRYQKEGDTIKEKKTKIY